jgi:hypothetical protein
MGMSDDAFRAFDRRVRSDPVAALWITWQAARLSDAFDHSDGVEQSIATGSVPRGTSTKITDYDVITVLDHRPGSVREALVEMQRRIEEKHGVDRGTHTRMVKRTSIDNQVVTCHLTNEGPYGLLGSSPVIEVMPAYREGAHLVIPELQSPDWGVAHWVRTDPEQHNEIIAERQMFWSYFDSTVRATKVWGEASGLDLQGVAVELLVLKHMPRPRWFTSMSRGETWAKLFESAARHGVHHLESPVGLFGVSELKPPPNYGQLNKALKRAAELSRKALEAERLWSERREIEGSVRHPSHYWHELLGPDYPVDWTAEFIEAFRRWWVGSNKPGERTSIDPTVLYAYAPKSATRPRPEQGPEPGPERAPGPDPEEPTTPPSWTRADRAEPPPESDPGARYEAPVAHAAARTARRDPEPGFGEPHDPSAAVTILHRIQPKPPGRPVVFGGTAP